MFEKVFIIAEAGSNHNGKLDTALQLVRSAKEAGADAIKFQDFSLNSLFSVSYYQKVLGLDDQKWTEEIKKLSFNPDWQRKISEEAEKMGIVYFSTPFSLESVDILEPNVPFYKIASGDITFTMLLEKVASKGKGVFLSTGASTVEEIDRALEILKRSSLPFICLMHCIMLYPAPLSSLNLNFIDFLLNRYKLPVGFSDHSRGCEAALWAVAKGAIAIEKHFTLDPSQPGADHANSLSPEMFKELCQKIRECEQALGEKDKIITEREYRERIYARRGIYARKNLKKGDILDLNDVAFLRPRFKAGAEEFHSIVGKKLISDIRKGEPLEINDVEH